MTETEIRDLFACKKMKVTPQRIAVYSALLNLKHPCAEDIVDDVHKRYPTVTTGTIYNVLDCLLTVGLIKKVSTGNNKMYFDAELHEHHHLYCEKTHQISDYYDEELTEIIKKYIICKQIPGFKIEGIKLQIIGNIY